MAVDNEQPMSLINLGKPFYYQWSSSMPMQHANHITHPNPDNAQPHPQRPVQLSDTELMVIDGLQQLTKAIFGTQYKSLGESPRKNTVALSPSKLGANAGDARTPTTVAMSPSKNGRQNGPRVDEAMAEAEKFCAMVVQQIVSLDEAGDSHKNQLDVYHSVYKNLFSGGQ